MHGARACSAKVEIFKFYVNSEIFKYVNFLDCFDRSSLGKFTISPPAYSYSSLIGDLRRAFLITIRLATRRHSRQAPSALFHAPAREWLSGHRSSSFFVGVARLFLSDSFSGVSLVQFGFLVSPISISPIHSVCFLLILFWFIVCS